MRTRSAYHIDYTKSDLGGFEVKIWVGDNLTGVPTYEQIVQAIDKRVTVDIAELVNSLLPKDGQGSVKVRYKVDAFDDSDPPNFFKTWQKEYDAFFGYNTFYEDPQVDSELLEGDQFDVFNLDGDTQITDNEALNPWGENTATVFQSASDNIEISANIPTPSNNFSMFYWLPSGSYFVDVDLGDSVVAKFFLDVTPVGTNQLSNAATNNCEIKANTVGVFVDGFRYTFIQIKGFSSAFSGQFKLSINAPEARFYSPSVQDYFSPQGREQAIMQTNKELFWKKGEPIKFAYLINSSLDLSLQTPLTYFYKDGTSEFVSGVTLINTQPNNKEVERVEINISTDDNIVLPVSYLPCTKYKVRKIDFINKVGVRQSIFFYGSSRLSNRNQNESYKANILEAGSYDVEEHQFKNYNANGRQREVINTGYYSESFNLVFEELFLSERIWVDDKPATIVSNNFEELTKLVNDLINYEITFEYANDYISNVR